MRLLDLCCGVGGASTGYAQAGFTDIVGVDIHAQPRYPYQFLQTDALEFVLAHGAEFDVIHASPPCQLWAAGHNPHRASYPNLINPLRAYFLQHDCQYVIENVPRAPLQSPIQLCGGALACSTDTMQLHRHRCFESSFTLVGTPCVKSHKLTATITGTGTPSGTFYKLGRALTIGEKQQLMGIDWTRNAHELSEAIPPAYTKYLGEQILGMKVAQDIVNFCRGSR